MAKGIEGYSLVVNAWRNPDADLQPLVSEARAALSRLNSVSVRAATKAFR